MGRAVGWVVGMGHAVGWAVGMGRAVGWAVGRLGLEEILARAARQRGHHHHHHVQGAPPQLEQVHQRGAHELEKHPH